jgi:dipeptidyl aminopeptidase/acylaminoacyl peptidase
MTSPMSFDLTDAAIERMLAERVGSSTPGGLVSGIMAAVEATPQRRRGWIPRLVSPRPRSTRGRALLIAAAITIALLAVAAGMIVGAFISPPTQRLDPNPAVVPTPAVTTAPSATPKPTDSLAPIATFVPSPSDFSIVNGALVVYQFRDTVVDLYLLDPLTGRKVMIANLQKTSESQGQSIQWATDSKRAFVFADSDSVQAILDIEQGTVEPLGLGSSGGRDAVSPAGDLVARLEDDPVSGSSLSVVDLDGNEVRRTPLPANLQPFSDIAWAPDGSSVLVSGCVPCSESSGAQHDYVYAVPADGGAVQEVVERTTGSFGWLRWSPDMATIAFADLPCSEPCTGGIGTIRVRDGLVTPLTNDADRSPAWSRDGRRITFARDSGTGSGIYVMAADGGNPVRLSNATTLGGDRSPLWSPDGAWIVFSRVAPDGGLGDLYIVSSTGGEPRLLEQNAVADW